MADIKNANKIKNLVKFLVAVLILVILWAFFNDSTYNLFKKKLVRNSDKYTEMYAYSKSRPAFNKMYFIVQDNDMARSFFLHEVNFVSEDDLGAIKCSKEETFLIYEKQSSKISEFVRKKGGEELALNKGTDIEFYAAKIKGAEDSCKAN